MKMMIGHIKFSFPLLLSICQRLLLVLLATRIIEARGESQKHYKDPDELNVEGPPTMSFFPTPTPTTSLRPSSYPTESIFPSSTPTTVPTLQPTKFLISIPTTVPTPSPAEFDSQSGTLRPTFSLPLSSFDPTAAPRLSPSRSPPPTAPMSPTATAATTISPTFASFPSPSPSSSEEKDLNVVDDGVAVGLITALGVSGLAVIVAAFVVQRRRMFKAAAMPQMISDVSTAANQI